MKFTDTIAERYEKLYAAMRVKKSADVSKLLENRKRYEEIEDAVGVPWWWIAIVHHLEGGGNFATHLHNGDPLWRGGAPVVTVHRPSGRGPFDSWEKSAADALRIKKLDEVDEWSLGRALYEFERYNGFGYVGKINSPYLWSGSNLYRKGKYVRDGVWDAAAVSKQTGAALYLAKLVEVGAVRLPEGAVPEQPAEDPEERATGKPSNSRILRASTVGKRVAEGVGVVAVAHQSGALDAVATASEHVGAANGLFSALKTGVDLLAGHPLLLLAGGALAAWLVFEWIARWRTEDHRTGRHIGG